MAALHAVGSVSSAPRIAAPPPSDSWTSHTVRCVTHWGRSGAVISVDGELDASNADQLTEHVQHCAAYCEWLVLDLNNLEFIGTAGFSALQLITSRCADAMTRCTTVPGTAVSRLLHICDPADTLPTTASVAGALADMQDLQQAR